MEAYWILNEVSEILDKSESDVFDNRREYGVWNDDGGDVDVCTLVVCLYFTIRSDEMQWIPLINKSILIIIMIKCLI